MGASVPGYLARHGVEVVFGIPGVHTLEVFRGLAGASVRHVLTRHEQGAAFAADGYARVSGRAGVVFLIEGPGLTNAATAVAQAYHDSVPMLVLSAGPPRAGAPAGAPAGARLHDMPDQQAFMASIMAWSHRAESAEDLADALDRAFSGFGSARPRPVHVEVPVDLMTDDGGLRPPPPRVPTDAPLPSDHDLGKAAELLGGAQRPAAMIVGGGARDAGPQAADVAERIGAAVFATLNGKGAVPDDHPLHLGTTLPTGAAVDELETADVVLAVGTEFCEADYYYAGRLPRPKTIVRVDIDGGAVDSPYPATVALRGKAQATLAALASRLPAPEAAVAEAAAARAAAVRARVRWWPLADRLRPAVDAVGDALPDDAVVAVDSNQIGYVGQHRWGARRPRSWLVPAGWGTLGPSLPMAIGAAIGAPGRPVVCVCGDGGLLFTVGELATAYALGLPITLLVWDNDGYAEMRDEMDLARIDHIGTDGGAHAPTAILGGFGWSVSRVTTPTELRDAVAAGVAAGLPTAIVADAAKICP